MSLRGLEPAPAEAEPEGPWRPHPLLVAGVAIVVLVVGLIVASSKAWIQLPFVGKPTVTEANATLGWSITFPKAWAKKKGSGLKPPIYYVSQGGGVGIKIQAELLSGEMPAGGTTNPELTADLDKIEKASNRPDITFLQGPGHGGVGNGTIHGVPFVHYLITYTDFSTGIPILLEDDDYYFFNGAKEEQVTFETDAKDYAKNAADINKAIQTFTSRHISAGSTPLPTPPGATTTATP